MKQEIRIPQYTNIVKNYQEKALESTAKITEDYIRSTKINNKFCLRLFNCIL